MDSEKCDKTVINYAVSGEAAQGDKISYFIFESVQARNERTIRRLWISTIILVILLFVSNALWLWFFSGAEVESYEVTADSNSNAYYNEIGNNFKGDVNNGGTDKSQTDNSDERSEEEIYAAQSAE